MSSTSVLYYYPLTCILVYLIILKIGNTQVQQKYPNFVMNGSTRIGTIMFHLIIIQSRDTGFNWDCLSFLFFIIINYIKSDDNLTPKWELPFPKLSCRCVMKISSALFRYCVVFLFTASLRSLFGSTVKHSNSLWHQWNIYQSYDNLS